MCSITIRTNIHIQYIYIYVVPARLPAMAAKAFSAAGHLSKVPRIAAENVRPGFVPFAQEELPACSLPKSLSRSWRASAIGWRIICVFQVCCARANALHHHQCSSKAGFITECSASSSPPARATKRNQTRIGASSITSASAERLFRNLLSTWSAGTQALLQSAHHPQHHQSLSKQNPLQGELRSCNSPQKKRERNNNCTG